MTTPWDRFLSAARDKRSDAPTSPVPVALIVDSPWLPGFAAIDTRDYFLFPEEWLRLNLRLLEQFPEVAWVPGFWVEYGMAAEPSAFGCRMHFYPDRPPAVEPLYPHLSFWAETPPVNPHEDGLMPLVLRLYQRMDERLAAQGLAIHAAAARGPLTSASWLVGIGPLMEGMLSQPDLVNRLLETVTTSLVRWLEAQLACLRQPQAVLLLDDLVGMVSRRTYQELVAPHLQRIFGHFHGLVRIYHNDTPCKHLLEPLAQAGFDVFNFSHQMDIAEVKTRLGGHSALMGNVAPLDLGVRGTPEEVYAAAISCLDRAAPGGGVILSFGGGVSPGTPAENIHALTRAAKDWSTL
jgi:uroporphyrinogen decarboxylase